MPTAKARHISLKHKKKDLYFTSLVSVIMDADAVTALLTGLGGQIATGINQALANANSGNNADQEGTGPRSPIMGECRKPDTEPLGSGIVRP